MSQPPGRPISLTTDRLVVRSLAPADASELWGEWYNDPEVMGPLNLPPKRRTVDELARHAADYDDDRRYLIGLFTRANFRHIGLFMVVADKAHATATFNVMIGDKDYWGKGVVNEARAALLDEFFQKRETEKACGRPLARNFPAVFNYKAQGWRLEGMMRGQCRSAIDGSRLDQYLFGMLREEWRRRRGQAA